MDRHQAKVEQLRLIPPHQRRSIIALKLILQTIGTLAAVALYSIYGPHIIIVGPKPTTVSAVPRSALDLSRSESPLAHELH